MGMLQLAGMVSGFGKGLQQGLQQTQQYMSHSLLLKEREEMELARQKLTFAHDEGMLQKRAAIEAGAADLAHSRARDLAEDREDFEMRKGRIERDAVRTDEAAKAERTQQNTVTNKTLDASIQQQRDADQAKRDRAKEERDRIAADRKFQQDAGLRLTEKAMELSKPSHAGGVAGRLDPAVASRAKDLDLEIDALLDERKSIRGDVVMKDEEKKAALDGIDRKIMEVRNKKNKLIGQPEEQGSASTRQPYRFPD